MTICLCCRFQLQTVWSSHKSPWSAVVHSWHLKPPISRNSLEVCWSIIPSLDTGQSLSCPPNITMIRWEIESFRESRLSPSSRAVDAALMFYINPLAPPSNIFSIKNWIFFPSPLSFPLSIHHRLWNYPFHINFKNDVTRFRPIFAKLISVLSMYLKSHHIFGGFIKG